jgi:hypothetical protein
LAVLVFAPASIGLSTRALAQPANDNCGAAIAVSVDSTPFSIAGATTDGTRDFLAMWTAGRTE